MLSEFIHGKAGCMVSVPCKQERIVSIMMMRMRMRTDDDVPSLDREVFFLIFKDLR